MRCSCFFRGIFLTQGSSLRLLHGQAASLPLSHQRTLRDRAVGHASPASLLGTCILRGRSESCVAGATSRVSPNVQTPSLGFGEAFLPLVLGVAALTHSSLQKQTPSPLPRVSSASTRLCCLQFSVNYFPHNVDLPFRGSRWSH